MIRIRVTATEGSTPRDAGAEMFVSAGHVTGSIGGGRMERDAIEQARRMLSAGETSFRSSVLLGEDGGQDSSGRMELSFEQASPGPGPEHPQVLIFGASHVGRALARILSKLPFEVVLYDARRDELAKALQTTTELTDQPEEAIRAARPGAAFVIVSHDRRQDFHLAAEALRKGDAAYIGMVGSAAKRAAFEAEAHAAGLDPAPLTCPIGAGFSPDKRPELIAIFAAAEIAAILSAATATAN